MFGRFFSYIVPLLAKIGLATENKPQPKAEPMILRLDRFRSNHDATIGRLYLVRPYQSPLFLCHTLEDEHRYTKVKHETRIPAGRYDLRLRTWGGFHARYSDLFRPFHRGMIELQDVPDFTDILIHVGNTDEDTSGCILLGIWRGADNFIGDSRNTYARVYKDLLPLIETSALTAIEIVDRDR